MANKDYMLRASAQGQVMAFAVSSKNMAETARLAHHTTPVATAALGRLLSGTVMLADTLKNEDDKITVQVRGNGPLGGILVTADTFGNAKGYVDNPAVILPMKSNGHLDVGGAVGEGSLSVIKDMGLKDAYNGHVPLYSGEIAEDLTHYLLTSEQTPSSVGLGVLVDTKTLAVRNAGGFIIQLLPGAMDSVIDVIEKNIRDFGSVTDRLSENDDPAYLLELLLKDLDYEINKKKQVSFMCDCSRDRVRRAVKLLGDVELSSMIKEAKPIELKCQFCNKAYNFDIEELIAIKNEKQ